MKKVAQELVRIAKLLTMSYNPDPLVILSIGTRMFGHGTGYKIIGDGDIAGYQKYIPCDLNVVSEHWRKKLGEAAVNFEDAGFTVERNGPWMDQNNFAMPADESASMAVYEA